MTTKTKRSGTTQEEKALIETQLAIKELEQAYDATIEGWSRSFDLRARETEGHVQRVTELARQLGIAFLLSDEQLRYLRWGALLHDIGRLAIPEEILLKPGQLSETEWEVVRKHPQTAYNLLSPIPYLKQALEIPYCHHEWWDGTGYPRGLKSDEIPLAARIFTVVDVWDAMISDRPYRSAWPEKTAQEYIEAMAGISFDPGVVTKFIPLIRRNLRESTI